VTLVALFPLQLSKRAFRVFQELHLREIRAERVSRSRNCRHGSLSRLLCRVTRFLRGVPNRFAFLSNRFQLFAALLLERARFFSQSPETFRLRPRGFGRHAVSLGVDTLLVALLPDIFRVFASVLRIDTMCLRVAAV
jgi:hypothetical protein